MILNHEGYRTGMFSANPFLTGRFREGFETSVVERLDARQLSHAVVDWLRKGSGQRFFLYVQYMDLHHPLQPPDSFIRYFEPDGQFHPEHSGWNYGRLTEPENPAYLDYYEQKMVLYDAALRYVDEEISHIVRELDELGLLDNTVLIITSDHGEEFWDHAAIERLLGGDPRKIWGIGHGHSMFQELLWIPLIVHGPGVAAGRDVACPVRQLDILPTILELLETKQSMPLMSGQSLAPYIRSTASNGDCEAVPQIAASPAYGPEAHAVIWKGWKLITRKDGAELLFDLRLDADEKIELAATYPDIVTSLRRVFEHEQALTTSRSRELGDQSPTDYDTETQRELRALGYLSQ